MSFADTVKATVDSVDKLPQSTPAQAYLKVLNELANGLSQTGIGAAIVPGRDPRRSTLYLHPMHRPNTGFHMLVFHLSEDAIVVSGEEPTRITTPEALQDWLLDFIKLPAFRESMAILRDRATQPVDARLCVGDSKNFTRGDVLVMVQPEDQVRLDAAPGTVLTFEVERMNFPGNAPIDPSVTYTELDSAGLVMRVTGVELHG